MRIKRLRIHKEVTSTQGIAAIFMDRLGPVVALIGKNGSGKSRILNLVEKYEGWIDDYMLLDQSVGEGIIYSRDENSYKKDKINFDTINIANTNLYEKYMQRLASFCQESNNKEATAFQSKAWAKRDMVEIQERRVKKKLLGFEKVEYIGTGKYEHVKRHEKYFNDNELKTVLNGLFERNPIRRIRYSDIHALKSELENQSTTLSSLLNIEEFTGNINEIEVINQTGLPYFYTLPHFLVRDFRKNTWHNTDVEQEETFKQYRILQKMIKDFMGKELEYKYEVVNDEANEKELITRSVGKWYLNDHEFNYAKLSDGEKTLFAYSLLFFLYERNAKIPISESIILIDEPELHLHPGSEVAVVQGIRNIIENKGQLWIATHSLSILSSLQPNEIFLVKDNAIQAPSRTTPGQSLEELFEIPSILSKMNHFVTNHSNWSYINFIEQCFNNPEVIAAANPDDPQLQVFKKAIHNHKEGNILLDFGAGKGRIFKEIVDDDLLDMEYYALEPDAKNRQVLKEAGVGNVFSAATELPYSLFHFICMCNVLHEMNINTWIEELNAMLRSLNNDGQLIIIEDLVMPIGEWIDGAGFLTLDKESIGRLFNLDDPCLQIIPAAEEKKDQKDVRILCLVIDKKKIKPVSRESVIGALEKRKENVWNRMMKIKPLEQNNQNGTKATTRGEANALGREFAFLSQLYINCQRGIAILEKRHL